MEGQRGLQRSRAWIRVLAPSPDSPMQLQTSFREKRLAKILRQVAELEKRPDDEDLRAAIARSAQALARLYEEFDGVRSWNAERAVASRASTLAERVERELGGAAAAEQWTALWNRDHPGAVVGDLSPEAVLDLQEDRISDLLRHIPSGGY